MPILDGDDPNFLFQNDADEILGMRGSEDHWEPDFRGGGAIGREHSEVTREAVQTRIAGGGAGMIGALGVGVRTRLNDPGW